MGKETEGMHGHINHVSRLLIYSMVSLIADLTVMWEEKDQNLTY